MVMEPDRFLPYVLVITKITGFALDQTAKGFKPWGRNYSIDMFLLSYPTVVCEKNAVVLLL